MASRMASICNHYMAGCTKSSPKILRPKNSEKEKNAPGKAQKGQNRVRFGCWREVQPVWTGVETRKPNQNEPKIHATHAKRKPAKTQCFRRFCGRGRRTWSRLPARVLLPGGERPAPTGAGAETGAAAPPARTAPSARGFGVDVGTLYRDRGRAGVVQFLPQVPGRAVLFWCCERLWQQFFKFFTHSASFENPTPLLGGFCCWKAPGGTHSGPRG